MDLSKRILRLLNNWVLVEWEEASQEIRFRDLRLIRPDTHKKSHYTGIVLKVGPDVCDEIKERIGKRIFFDQWTHEGRINNWQEADGKRYMILLDRSIHAEVPARMTVESTLLDAEVIV